MGSHVASLSDCTTGWSSSRGMINLTVGDDSEEIGDYRCAYCDSKYSLKADLKNARKHCSVEIESIKSMDALRILEQDHKRVKGLFEQAEQAGGEKDKKGIFQQINNEWETHATIEETVFYPAVEK